MMEHDAASTERRLSDGLARVVVGAGRSGFLLMVALLSGGHALIEGVPGTAKTLTVRVLARLLGVSYGRIQFTPDLMPSDVVGTTVFDQRSATFSLRRGPVFANIVLADEVNRTPPKTQAALLEAMEERRVTIDGTTYDLPAPFLVCATQNPVEFEGTYPLPEAQLDRFLVRVRTGYPSPADERALIARAVAGFDARDLDAAGVTTVVSGDELLAAQRAVRAVHLAESLQGYVYDIVAATRTSPDVALGASPRAGLALVVATQAAAFLDGRAFATPDDVKDVAPAVLAHRLIVRPEAELDGTSADDLVARVLASVSAPET
ncbi:MAG TPA: MoxR family ATPase [Candidatus Elarobacter sp.]|jgi:MoxR-like ATPase|nr:MoxR family ATPase [Candidatus Elarobacter sp.]